MSVLRLFVTGLACPKAVSIIALESPGPTRPMRISRSGYIPFSKLTKDAMATGGSMKSFSARVFHVPETGSES
jgi:hypothetical protein